MRNIGDYIPQSAQITLTGEEYVTFITVAKEHERERIIKLLEEVLKFDTEQEKRNLFALITGEQK